METEFCPDCRTKVLVLDDRKCPNCRNEIAEPTLGSSPQKEGRRPKLNLDRPPKNPSFPDVNPKDSAPESTGNHNPYSPPKSDLDNRWHYHGNSISEAEYLLAKKHNVFRWILFFAIGIPAFVLTPFRTWLKGLIFGPLLFLFFRVASALFPQSQLYGSTIYRKYHDHRKMVRFRETGKT
tara:strand:- start:9586 stop:10125 length:540 start_codon:yes stop_codon:yes gene_type:complete